MKKYLLKFIKYSGSLAVTIAVLSNNTTCTWYIHQPEIPKSVKRLKYVTRTGVYNGNLKIDLSNSNAAGTRRKLRLANYYNLSFNDTNAPVQSASGTFVY